MAEHDQSYKLLFSHPQMMVDLLRGFVHEPWVDDLDMSTLETVSTRSVSDDLREREDDIIWRVRWRGEWLYIYLLLEFQSTVARFMAVRILTYVGLLYEDLIKQKLLAPDGLLPPVVPIVIYNGRGRWTAPREVGDLITRVPNGPEQYRPQLRYLLLAENEFDEAELAPLKNLVAALFRIENSESPAGIQRVLEALVEWLQAPDQEDLRRAFTVWMKRVLLPARFPGAAIPEVEDLQEVKAMLAERVIEWTKEWKEQGWAEGARQEALAAVLDNLSLHFRDVPAGIRERLERITDLETLRVLRRQAVTVGSLPEFEASLNQLDEAR